MPNGSKIEPKSAPVQFTYLWPRVEVDGQGPVDLAVDASV